MRRFFKILKSIFNIIIVLLLVGFISLQLPFVQKGVAELVKNKLLDKNGLHEVTFERIGIGLTGKIYLGNLKIPGSVGDNLLELRGLSARVSVRKLFQKKLVVKKIALEGVKGQIIRFSDNQFNFSYLVKKVDKRKPVKEKGTNNFSFEVNKVKLDDIQFRYYDSISQVFLDVNLGHFTTNMDDSELARLDLVFDKIKLKNTNVILSINEKLINQNIEKKSNSLLPIVNADRLSIKNVTFQFNDLRRSSYLKAEVNQVESGDIFLDISNEQIGVGRLELENSTYIMDYTADTTRNIVVNAEELFDSNKVRNEISFSGGWEIGVQELEGRNNEIDLKLKTLSDSLPLFHSSNFGFSDIDFVIRNTLVEEHQVKSKIEKLSCSDKNGFVLGNARIDAIITNSFGRVVVEELKTNNSDLSARIDVVAPLNNIQLDNAIIKDLKLTGAISQEDINYFIPNAKSEKYINNKLNVSLLAKGSKDELLVKVFELNTGKGSKIKANMSAKSYSDFNKLDCYLNIDTFRLDAEEFNYLLDTSTVLGKMALVSCKLNIHKKKNEIGGSFLLSDGIGVVNGIISGMIHGDTIKTSTKINFTEIDLSKYIIDSAKLKMFGDIEVQAMSKGIDSIMSISFSGELDSIFTFQDSLADVQLSGTYSNNKMELYSNHTSDNLAFNTGIKGVLDGDSLWLNYTVNLDNMNTRSIGLTKHDVGLSAKLNGEALFYNDNYLVRTFFSKFGLMHNNELYNFPGASLFYIAEGDYDSLSIDFKGISLRAYTDMDANEVKTEFISYLRESLNPDKQYEPDTTVCFGLQCKVVDPKSLQKFLGTTVFDTLIVDYLTINLDLQKGMFDFETRIPYIGYKGILLEELESDYLINSGKFQSNTHFNQLVYQKVSSNRVELDINNSLSRINSTLKAYDEENEIAANFPVYITQKDSLIKFRILTDSLLIGYQKWEMNDNVAVQYNFKDNNWSSEGTYIYFEDQSVEFVESKTEAKLIAKNLNLANMSYFFAVSDTNYITNGLLSGYMSIASNYENKWLMNCEIDIDDLMLLDMPYGDLNLCFSEGVNNNYNITLDIKNNTDYLHYNGEFDGMRNSGHSGKIQVNNLSAYSVVIDTNKLNLIEGTLSSEINAEFRNRSAKIRGNIILSNTLVHLPQIGSKFKIRDETIRLTENGVHFDDVKVEDMANNSLYLNGDILTSNYKDFHYKLNIYSDFFELVNASRGINQNYYGQLAIKAEIDISGTNLESDLKADLRIHDNTNFTIVLPGEDPLRTGSQDIVRFSNEINEESDSIFIERNLRTVSDSIGTVIRSSKVNLMLTFNPNARYTVITDPISGDYAHFGLNGALVYRTLENNLSEIIGNVQVVEGLYQMSFYEMVKKEFTIEPNSTVFFSGPVRNATVDLSAKHTVRTNSLALMSSESIGNSPEEKALYNQRLPYELYFNVEGLLMSPNVSFALDLPAEYKQTSPMIASKLNKLASPEMEQERNMQVFALLVTGGFIAENTSVASGSGSSDIATTTARNSLNSILSQQLNNITSENIQYFDMNLGLNTYEDYARRGGRTTTDLDVQISKKLFDDRVSFELESRINLDGNSNPSQSKSNYNTDYRLYYDLNESKTLKAKAYNLSIYDLFDGDITNAGVGIMYSKDFNSRKQKNYVEADSVNINEQDY